MTRTIGLVVLLLGIFLVAAACSTPPAIYIGAVLPPQSTSNTYLRIVALGDAGTGGLGGGRNQQLVADDLATRADPAGENQPVDFVLYLGDNFYEDGVDSTTDLLWDQAYTTIYNFSLLPKFYVVAGNHDHRGDVWAQVDYTAVDPAAAWTMPDLAYSFTWLLSDATRIDFIGIDTQILVGGGSNAAAHWAWLEDRLQAVSGGNIVVFGHHPVYSAGDHGDTPVLVSRLQPLLSAHGVDIYFAGHDHNLEIRQAVNGVHHVISGSGGKLRAITGEPESLYAESTPGALVLDLDASGFTFTARDSQVGSDDGSFGPYFWN